MSNFTIGILGTGRLGTHTAATWAAAGHRVLLGSRDSEKARRIVDGIRSPAGYRGKGGEQTMAIPESAHANLEGTDMAGKRRPHTLSA
jgi:predicted dinucleotide-binding enzyme